MIEAPGINSVIPNLMDTSSSVKEIEPVIFKLDETIKLIPYYSAEYDFYQFINSCNPSVNAIDIINVPILIRYITIILFRKVLELIKYKDTSKWINIKNI